MPSVKGGVYQRGQYWLDYARGAGGEPVSPRFYIYWYDAERGRQRRKSTGTGDVRLACDALDAHWLATHRPDEQDRRTYTVAEAMTDYFVEVGSTRISSDSIKARLLLFTRFIEVEAAAARLPSPFLPAHVDDRLIARFRQWGVADPIIARRKDEDGQWVRDGKRRKRNASTVEESVIQLKAAIRHAHRSKRVAAMPEVTHQTRAQVTPARNHRLSVAAIGELLDYAARGGSGRYSTPERLMPLRRYVIAAVATIGRPDAIFDVSVLPGREQWLSGECRLDLNPAGRLQTRKFRATLPVGHVFAQWLTATDDWFVCMPRRVTGVDGSESVRQFGVASVRKSWDTARAHLGLPEGWGVKLLRHSMATILANRGVNPLELRIAMGHEALVGSTARYVIFQPSYLAGFAQIVAEIFDELMKLAPAAFILPDHGSD